MGRSSQRRRLEYQADRLEQVLAAYHTPAWVQGGTVTPRLVRFHLTPARGTRVAAIARLAEELALTLGAPSARVWRNGGQVEVEIPRQEPGQVRLSALLKQLDWLPSGTAVLGLDDEGAPLLLRLSSPEVAHVLICGTTGSGKTALARSMILSLARRHSLRELGLVLIDPKGRGYSPLAGLPHLARPVATEVGEAAALLSWLVGVMERRDQAGSQRPRLVCFIDELADLMLSGGKPLEAGLTRLVQRGRGAGVHVVACTQKPTAAVIGSLVKSNFPVRVVGSVVSPEDAKVATGLAGTGAEKLLGRGDFLLVAKGQTYRFQAAYVAPEELEAMVQELRAGRRLTTVQQQPASKGVDSDRIAGDIEHIQDRVAQLRLIK